MPVASGSALSYAFVVLATFGVTRLVDHLAAPPNTALPHHTVAVREQPCPQANNRFGGDRVAAAAPPHEAAAVAEPPRPSRGGRRTTSASQPYLAVIGFPIGIDERNTNRRALLRELWFPEYPNLGPGGSIRAEFVIGLLSFQGDGHDEVTIEQLHSEHRQYGDLSLVNAREATRDPYRGDPKNTGEKILAWFQRVVVEYRGTRFFLKADWDTWIHTTRLEHNLRALLAQREGPAYFGNTLWCSYSIADFQPCGYGFGPLQAAGSKAVECPNLPHGKDAIGPYPYAAGLFWGMSYELVQWIAGSRLIYDFYHNASGRFAPPYWIKGEDSAYGFFAHISPFPQLTPIHWGWDVIHDGWEFRSEKERGLCTHHTSDTSLVVHSMHTRQDFLLVRQQLRERCNATCERQVLPFSVDGLKDLCSRNPRIPSVYSRCKEAGFRAASPELTRTPLPPIVPRPRCRSVGENVAFIAAKEEGGTITCDPPADPEWSLEWAEKRRQGMNKGNIP